MFTCSAKPCMFACEDSFEELFLSPSCVIRRWKPGHQVWKHVPLLLSHIRCSIFFYYTAVATETPPNQRRYSKVYSGEQGHTINPACPSTRDSCVHKQMLEE